MDEAKCSVNFKLWAPDGAQMQFTLRDDDPASHLALLTDYRTKLLLSGYSVAEPNFDGQKSEEINAYVMGESSKGDACVYLYSSKPALKWRLATVYVERFGELPFTPAGKCWQASAAPERLEAEKKGFLQDVPPFKITLEQTEPDAEGKAHWRYAGVQPGNGPKPAAATPDAEFASLPSASADRANAASDVRSKFAALVAQHNAPQPATDDERARAFNNLRTLCGNSDDKRKAVVRYLTGKDSLTEITAGEAHAIRDWVRVAKAGTEWAPSAAAVEDLKAILAANPA